MFQFFRLRTGSVNRKTALSTFPNSFYPKAPTATADISQPTSSVTGNSAPPPIDPAQWPSKLSDQERNDLVYRGPANSPSPIYTEAFTTITFRNLANGEKVKR